MRRAGNRVELRASEFTIGGLITLLDSVLPGIGAPVPFIGITAAVGALGGSASLLLARMANRSQLFDAPQDDAELAGAQDSTARLR